MNICIIVYLPSNKQNSDTPVGSSDFYKIIFSLHLILGQTIEGIDLLRKFV